MAYSAFTEPNISHTIDSHSSAHHIPSRSLPFSIIIASLLFFIGRFLICLFRDFYLFSKLVRFSKVRPVTLCWMPNVISLPEWYVQSQESLVHESFVFLSLLLIFFFGRVFFNGPSGARTIEPKALNIIILSFDSTPYSRWPTPNTSNRNLHNNFKIDPSRVAVVVQYTYRHSSTQHLLLTQKTFAIHFHLHWKLANENDGLTAIPPERWKYCFKRI